MISEEDKERYVEASKCEDCPSWHKYCDAECCKIIFLNMDLKKLNRLGRYVIVKPREVLGMGDALYYKWRGVDYIRGILRFPKEKIVVIGRRILYIHPCKLLKDNLCTGHPDHKPEICKALTLESAKLPGQPFELTDNCLFKFKCKEVKLDG